MLHPIAEGYKGGSDEFLAQAKFVLASIQEMAKCILFLELRSNYEEN